MKCRLTADGRYRAKAFSPVLGFPAYCFLALHIFAVSTGVFICHSEINAENHSSAALRSSEPVYSFNPSLLPESRSLSAQTHDDASRRRAPISKPSVNDDPNRALIQRELAAALQLRSLQLEESNKQALQKFAEAADLSRAIPDWESTAAALRNAGEISHLLSRTKEAFAFYDSALSASRKAGNRLEEGLIRNDIGYLHFVLGNTPQAKLNCLAALTVGAELGNFDLQAQASINLGYAFYTSGDLVRSTDYETKALSLLKNVNDEAAHSKALVCLGYDYLNLGEPQKARESQQEAVEVAQRSQDLFAQSSALIALANLQAKLGERQEALGNYNRARDLVQRIGAANIEATVLGGLGYVSFSLGEKDKALAYDQQALKLFFSTNDNWGVAEASLDLGRIYHSLNDDRNALNYYQQALKIFNAIPMPRLAAQTLRDMGLAYASMGEAARAIGSYLAAIHQTRTGQDQREEAYTLTYLANAYLSLGQREKAVSSYHQALKLSRTAGDEGGQSLVLYKLACAEAGQGHLDEARAKLEAAIALIESLRAKVASQDSRAAYFASTHEYFERYADVLMQLHRATGIASFEAAAFEASEAARSRSLLESLAETRTNIHEGVDPALVDRERMLEQALNIKAERQMRLTASKNAEEAATVAQEIDQLATQYEELRGQIRAQSPHYAALTQPLPLTLSDVQQQVLDDDSLLLEYLLTDERSYVWVISRSAISGYELPPGKQIEEAAQRFYKLLTASQPVAGESFDQRQSRIAEAKAKLPPELLSFSNLVLGPIRDKLGKKRLLIVADGALQYIPFQALTVPGSDSTSATPADSADLWSHQTPLIIEHEIVNEPSASALALVLRDSAERKRAPNSVAVFANPVFDSDDSRVQVSANGGDLTTPPDQLSGSSSAQSQIREAFRDVGLGEGLRIPTLPSSREEADAIISVVPWRSSLEATDFNASRAAVVGTNLAQYRIVHFATHGLIDYQHPELSGLVLSLVDPKGQSQDGFLRMHDIYNLKLPVDLVVLSACNTGLGKAVKGEGLIGLTRGFMYAGAASVAASLWKVEDDATAELMKTFYAGMFRDGLTPAAALRQAQISMWQQKRWRAPYYWAAFVLQGQYDQKENFIRQPPRLTLPITLTILSALGAIALLLWLGPRKTQRVKRLSYLTRK